MRIIAAIVFFLSIQSSIVAQSTHTIDSLSKALVTEKIDSSKARILLKLSDQFIRTKPDTTFSLLKRAIAANRQHQKTSLHAMLQYKLAEAFQNKGIYDSTYFYRKQALHLWEKLNDLRGQSAALNGLGIYFFYQSAFDSAIVYLQQSIHFDSLLNDSAGMAKTLSNLGIMYNYKNDFLTAINYYIKSSEIEEKLDNLEGMAGSYNNIALLYDDMGQYAKANTYFEKALAIKEELGDKKSIISTLINYGISLKNQGNFHKALKGYERALKLAEEIEYPLGISLLKSNIALVYVKQKKYDDAIALFSQSLEIHRRLDAKMHIANTLANIGDTYRQKGQPAKGLPFIEEAYTLQKNSENKKALAEICKMLSENYADLGKFEPAFRYHKEFQQLSEQYLNEEMNSKVVELETKYETEKKTRQINSLKQESELKNAAIKSYRLQLFAISLFIVLLLLGGYFFYNQNQLKQQDKLNKSIIAEREAGIKAVVDATEAERQRIARDLHDSVGQKLGGLKLVWEQLSKETRDAVTLQKLETLKEILAETADEVRSISHQMMPKTLMEFGLHVAVRDALQKTLQHSNIAYEFNSNIENQRFEKRVEIGLFRIMQELISNIIKHSKATHITVNLVSSQHHLALIVEDNGDGFELKKANSGIGVLNMNTRIQIIDGNISFEPSANKGTIAIVRVPLKMSAIV